MSGLCIHCRCELVEEPATKQDAILRALGLGPRNLAQLAMGVYGANTPANRRKVSYQLREMRPAVESVCAQTGLWRLAVAHNSYAEAAA